MNIGKIEKLYEEKKHDKVVSECYEFAPELRDAHVLRLFLRSANIVGKKVYDRISEEIMCGETDYLFNRFMHGEKDEASAKGLLKKILSEDRSDLLEEYFLAYVDSAGREPVFEEMFGYLTANKNREIVLSYMKMTDEGGDDLKFSVLRSMLLRGDPTAILQKNDPTGITLASYECFLKDKEPTVELFEKFLSGAKFRESAFILFEDDLYRIEKYDREQNLFTIKDKLGRKRQVKYSAVAEKTGAIEGDDFRVYKYFKPEEGKEIDPCRLVVMILKYRNSALDRNQIKDELVYIFGKDASSYLTKNKKALEQCADIEIIYEKPERYVLAMEGNLVSNKVKKMKTLSQIRDYMMTALKNRELDEQDRKMIVFHIESLKERGKNEILHLVTGNEDYARNASDDELAAAASQKFIFDSLKSRLASMQAKEADAEFMEKLDPQHMERLFESSSKENRKMIMETVHRGFRLNRNTRLLEWYLTYHLEEGLFEMSGDYLLLRAIMISNDIYAMKKTDEFLNFMRRFFFDPKKERFFSLISGTSDETGKRIFDEFMKTLYLNDYQKDEIRRQVYSIRPEYRDYKASEFLLSTNASIKRKQAEFEEITEKTLPKLSKIIQEAAALGDLSENSEYKFSREQYRLFSMRAEELKNQLSKMEPIDLNGVKGDAVEAGTVVTIYAKKDKETRQYTVLGVFDVDVDRNVISYLSPLIKSISGMKKGDENEDYRVTEIKKYKEER